jgi:hypothetical protein
VLKEIFSAAGAWAAAGVAGLAGAETCAGSFFSEEFGTAWSGAFLQEAKERISKQGRIAKEVFFIIGKMIAGLSATQSVSKRIKAAKCIIHTRLV